MSATVDGGGGVVQVRIDFDGKPLAVVDTDDVDVDALVYAAHAGYIATMTKSGREPLSIRHWVVTPLAPPLPTPSRE